MFCESMSGATTRGQSRRAWPHLLYSWQPNGSTSVTVLSCLTAHSLALGGGSYNTASFRKVKKEYLKPRVPVYLSLWPWERGTVDDYDSAAHPVP